MERCHECKHYQWKGQTFGSPSICHKLHQLRFPNDKACEKFKLDGETTDERKTTGS